MANNKNNTKLKLPKGQEKFSKKLKQNQVLFNAIKKNDITIWNKFVKKQLDALIEIDLSGVHLHNANLCGANLSGVNLTDANLYGVHLHNANLSGANLRRVNLSNSNLMTANLSNANLLGANLSGASLYGTNLSGANLRVANFDQCSVFNVLYNRKGRYQGIRISTAYGNPLFQRFAQDQEYIEAFRAKRPKWWSKLKYYIWLVFADCGRSLWPWICWSVAFAMGFAWIFYALGPGAILIKNLPFNFQTMCYYSIVTFTTLGFGDIMPLTNKAAWWIMVEVITGYVMLGGLISILANKLARRSSTKLILK